MNQRIPDEPPMWMVPPHHVVPFIVEPLDTIPVQQQYARPVVRDMPATQGDMMDIQMQYSGHQQQNTRRLNPFPSGLSDSVQNHHYRDEQLYHMTRGDVESLLLAGGNHSNNRNAITCDVNRKHFSQHGVASSDNEAIVSRGGDWSGPGDSGHHISYPAVVRIEQPEFIQQQRYNYDRQPGHHDNLQQSDYLYNNRQQRDCMVYQLPSCPHQGLTLQQAGSTAHIQQDRQQWVPRQQESSQVSAAHWYQASQHTVMHHQSELHLDQNTESESGNGQGPASWQDAYRNVRNTAHGLLNGTWRGVVDEATTNLRFAIRQTGINTTMHSAIGRAAQVAESTMRVIREYATNMRHWAGIRSQNLADFDTQNINFVSLVEEEDAISNYFNRLHAQFYTETVNWMFQYLCCHPQAGESRRDVEMIAAFRGSTMMDTCFSAMLAYIEDLLLNSHRTLVEAVLLTQLIAARRGVDPIIALRLQEVSTDIGISLQPLNMLRDLTSLLHELATRLQSRYHSPSRGTGPGASRRRTRERNTPHEPSPERRAFQPPNPILRPSHSTVLPHHQQQAVVVDMDQSGRHVGWRDNVPVSNPVTVAPYAIPVCTGPHHLPVCTTTHIPVCTTAQPTWSLPACTVFPTCSIQHIPACSLQQIPVTHGAITPMLHAAAHPPQYHMTHHPPHPQPHHHHPHHHPHHNPHPHPHPHLQAPQHLPAATQFLPTTPSPPTMNRTHHHTEDDIQIIGERRPMYHHPHIPSAMHTSHPVPPLNPSPPVILQEPTVHPTPQEFYGPFSRYQNRRTTHRNRWRSIPPPPPPYPGFLLHFLAMLGNPPYPPHMVDINDDTAEVENYEALLNLAERLGEAKPRGLTKADIDQLPSYRFNVDTRTDEDQTSCVVCMCDFEQKQHLRVLPCSHEFHIKCVDKWLKSNRTCPICRADSSGSAHAE